MKQSEGLARKPFPPRVAARSAYVGDMDEKARQQLALFRIAVLGPLVGARLEHGELVELCREAAARTWELPSGAVIDVSARTIEDWFSAERILMRSRDRRRAASPAISPVLA